ncbi:MAG: hypothetical protein JWO35_859 [Candidatus Saccharibacteria bacterium]|nr:hypothetical protein [Candidatus Saccharibacteria bacterium]
MYFDIDKRTAITVLILLIVVGGGIAFMALHPAARQANDNLMQQSDLEAQRAAPNPNQ